MLTGSGGCGVDRMGLAGRAKSNAVECLCAREAGTDVAIVDEDASPNRPVLP